MPMKPVAPDKIAPMRKPIATVPPQQQAEADEDDDADNADRRILPPEIGLRALGDRAGNFCMRCEPASAASNWLTV